MANPRDVRFYDELDYHGTTFKSDVTVTFSQVPTYGFNHSPQIGLAVALVGSGQVGLGATGNPLVGKLKAVEADLNVTVQDQGYVVLGYPLNDVTAPVVGSPVAVDGTGKVVKAAAGNNIIVAVDTVGLTCTVHLL
jgi:hypothetical protein